MSCLEDTLLTLMHFISRFLTLIVKYFSPHTNIGIVRISREELHIVWGALTFIKELKGRSCMIKVIHTSGMPVQVISFAHLFVGGGILYSQEGFWFLRSCNR